MNRNIENALKYTGVLIVSLSTAIHFGCECHHGHDCPSPKQECQAFRCVDTLANAPTQTTTPPPTTAPTTMPTEMNN